MNSISVRITDSLLEALGHGRRGTRDTTRADLIRQALQRYVEDVEDLNLVVKRLHNPADTDIELAERSGTRYSIPVDYILPAM